jgi:quercetin dioxygenase-like cupin family protein
VERVTPSTLEWEPGPAAHFTGRVRLAARSRPADDAGLLVLSVTFAPGARTHWHSHPGGQVLHVEDGSGLVANEAGEAVALSTGDTVTIAADELHWHGAAAGGPMTHLSLTQGGVTAWLDRPVTDEEHRAASVAAGIEPAP